MLGIVIANWNGEKILYKCLESLKNQTYKNFKLYIVDNNSQDKSKNIINKFIKTLNMELIELNYNSGFAFANNIGIAKAIDEKCDYILTLNNDIEIHKDCLKSAMKEVSRSKQYDIFQLFMVNYFNRNICDAAGLKFNKSLLVKQIGYKKSIDDVVADDFEIEGACAGAAIYSKYALEKVKINDREYFDNSFFAYYEDVDLALRLRNKGFKSKFLKNSIVYHMHSATSKREVGFKEYYLFRNLLICMKKNQSNKEYEKNRKKYYFIILITILKNRDFNVIKVAIKAINDSR